MLCGPDLQSVTNHIFSEADDCSILSRHRRRLGETYSARHKTLLDITRRPAIELGARLETSGVCGERDGQQMPGELTECISWLCQPFSLVDVARYRG